MLTVFLLYKTESVNSFKCICSIYTLVDTENQQKRMTNESVKKTPKKRPRSRKRQDREKAKIENREKAKIRKRQDQEKGKIEKKARSAEIEKKAKSTWSCTGLGRKKATGLTLI